MGVLFVDPSFKQGLEQRLCYFSLIEGIPPAFLSPQDLRPRIWSEKNKKKMFSRPCRAWFRLDTMRINLLSDGIV